jgi:hypothetical protein
MDHCVEIQWGFVRLSMNRPILCLKAYLLSTNLKDPTVRCFWYDENTYGSEEGGHDESNPGCPAPTKVRLCDETPVFLLARREGTM